MGLALHFGKKRIVIPDHTLKVVGDIAGRVGKDAEKIIMTPTDIARDVSHNMSQGASKFLGGGGFSFVLIIGLGVGAYVLINMNKNK